MKDDKPDTDGSLNLSYSKIFEESSQNTIEIKFTSEDLLDIAERVWEMQTLPSQVQHSIGYYCVSLMQKYFYTVSYLPAVQSIHVHTYV